MTHVESATTAVSYEPAAIYYADSDCVEYAKLDGYCLYERVDPWLTLIKDATGHNLIGFKLKGFRNTFERLKTHLKLSDNLFLPLMSAIEDVYSRIGGDIFDERRAAAYKAAYQLASNDNVRLSESEFALAA